MVISDSGEHRLPVRRGTDSPWRTCNSRQLAERFERSRTSALHMFAASCRELQAGTPVLPNMKIDKAVILAAGRGTRMRELTAEVPKPMIEVRGKPVLQHIVEGLQRRRNTRVSSRRWLPRRCCAEFFR